MNLKLKVIKHNIKQCAIVTSLNKKSCSFHIKLQSKLPVRVNRQAAEIFTMHKMFSVIRGKSHN